MVNGVDIIFFISDCIEINWIFYLTLSIEKWIRVLQKFEERGTSRQVHPLLRTNIASCSEARLKNNEDYFSDNNSKSVVRFWCSIYYFMGSVVAYLGPNALHHQCLMEILWLLLLIHPF